MTMQLFDVKSVRRSKKRQALIVRWIMELRLGSYKQTHSFLRQSDQNGRSGYCCLGVLADMVDSEGWKPSLKNGGTFSHRLGKRGDTNRMISPKLCRMAGLSQSIDIGDFQFDSAEGVLADKNDEPISFKKIALMLERSLKAALK
jgi:hypothetical protein